MIKECITCGYKFEAGQGNFNYGSLLCKKIGFVKRQRSFMKFYDRKYKIPFEKTEHFRREKAIKWFVNNLKKEELGFLAGLIEGEGTISLNKHKQYIRPYIQISNTRLELLDWVIKRIPIFKMVKHKRTRQYRLMDGLICQINYTILIVGRHVGILLNALIPYLVTKKKNAELLIEWIELRKKQRQSEGYLPRHIEILNDTLPK